jgi:hypothetical protein
MKDQEQRHPTKTDREQKDSTETPATVLKKGELTEEQLKQASGGAYQAYIAIKGVKQGS